MSLRARLVLVVIAVLGAGLLASSILISTALESYLYRRVDSQLNRSVGAATHFLASTPPASGPTSSPPRFAPGGAVAGRDFSNVADAPQVARVSPNGKVNDPLRSPFVSAYSVFTRVPQSVLRRAQAGGTARFTVSDSSGTYRGVAERITNSRDLAVAVLPLRDVQATLNRLRWIALTGGLVLLGTAAASASWLVRAGLSPLRHMADTAEAVAEGEVQRRVDVQGGSEVARLGRALNSAFDARASSEQTLRRFIADASHELRTPLTAIRGYAELFDAGALQDTASAQRAAQRIASEAARMGSLVDDLLALARLDEHRPLELEAVDLTSLALDAVHDAQAVEPERPIALHASQPVTVTGDSAALRQVFANLLGNARVHTPAGTAVDVRVERDPERCAHRGDRRRPRPLGRRARARLRPLLAIG